MHALEADADKLKAENEALRDEIACLKELPSRPPFDQLAWRKRRNPDTMLPRTTCGPSSPGARSPAAPSFSTA